MQTIEKTHSPYSALATSFTAASEMVDMVHIVELYEKQSNHDRLAEVRRASEVGRDEALALTESLMTLYRFLDEDESDDISPHAFIKMLDMIRQFESRIDFRIARDENLKDAMMPMRRAMAESRSWIWNIVHLLQQKQPLTEDRLIPSKVDPAGLRELARVNTRLLHEKFG